MLCDEADFLLHERENFDDGFLREGWVELLPASAMMIMVDDAGESLGETKSAHGGQTLVTLAPPRRAYLAVKGGVVDMNLVWVDADNWACC